MAAPLQDASETVKLGMSRVHRRAGCNSPLLLSCSLPELTCHEDPAPQAAGSPLQGQDAPDSQAADSAKASRQPPRSLPQPPAGTPHAAAAHPEQASKAEVAVSPEPWPDASDNPSWRPAKTATVAWPRGQRHRAMQTGTADSGSHGAVKSGPAAASGVSGRQPVAPAAAASMAEGGSTSRQPAASAAATPAAQRDALEEQAAAVQQAAAAVQQPAVEEGWQADALPQLHAPRGRLRKSAESDGAAGQPPPQAGSGELAATPRAAAQQQLQQAGSGEVAVTPRAAPLAGVPGSGDGSWRASTGRRKRRKQAHPAAAPADLHRSAPCERDGQQAAAEPLSDSDGATRRVRARLADGNAPRRDAGTAAGELS